MFVERAFVTEGDAIMMQIIVRVAFYLWRVKRHCGGRIVRSHRSNLRRAICAAEIFIVRRMAEHHFPC